MLTDPVSNGLDAFTEETVRVEKQIPCYIERRRRERAEVDYTGLRLVPVCSHPPPASLIIPDIFEGRCAAIAQGQKQTN